jgi:hypothetical protein
MPNGLRARDALLYSRAEAILSVIEDQLPESAENGGSCTCHIAVSCAAAKPGQEGAKLLEGKANPLLAV